ncbi:beta-ketoacyl synthase N-terminal-like domain-containing protein [Bacillus sp. JCM 19041]|uniref:beta-ketoacyl synthase N-terminal-like domain-containing protein n=1 Tax=Bacillus sp. JCM 19041 TaxID=1460637 RepID=UPI0006D0CC33
MKEQVVIKGIGCITPWGDIVEDVIRNDKERSMDTNLVKDFDLQKYVKRKGLRTLPKSTKMAIASTELALKDLDVLGIKEVPKERIGVFVGTSLSYVNNIQEFLEPTYEKNANSVSPIKFPNTVLNNISGWVSIVFGIEGINSTVNNGTMSGVDALIQAQSYLESNVIDRAIVITVDDIDKAIVHNKNNRERQDRVITESSITFILEKSHTLEGSYGLIKNVEAWMNPYDSIERLQTVISNRLRDNSSIEHIFLGSENGFDATIEMQLNARYQKEITKTSDFLGDALSPSAFYKIMIALFSSQNSLIIETNNMGNQGVFEVESVVVTERKEIIQERKELSLI